MVGIHGKLPLQGKVNFAKIVDPWVGSPQAGEHLPHGVKALLHHARADRMPGGRSFSHLELLSIQLQGRDQILIGIQEVVKVVGDTKYTPVAPGLGVSLGT